MAGASQVPKDDFLSLFSAEPGERITIPLQTPVAAVVTMSDSGENGSKVLTARLDGFGSADFALTLEPSGRIHGHILKHSETPGLKFEGGLNTAVAVAPAPADDIVCVRLREFGNELGLEPEPEATAEADPVEGEAGEPLAGIPVLQSRPGATRVIYLDFDGEVVRNTWWNNGARIDALPYSNQQNIAGIWEAISEDFAPFNVNVTTDRSVFDNANSRRRCMVIFTPTNDAAPGAGGVAYLNTFGDAVTYMCWVFNSGLNSAAEAGSHEAGHQLGLHHDGTNTLSYYSGHRHSATGIEWGPIMGAGYSRDITQWSNGGYRNSDNPENDLALIDDYLPYLADDHGDSIGAATAITSDSSGVFSNEGLIGTRNDVDFFRLETNREGDITVTASPSAGYRNLDIRLVVRDATGAVLNDQSIAAKFDATATLPGAEAGTYFVSVEGVGLGATGFAENGYDDYASLGRYTLAGSYPFGAAPLAPETVTATDGTDGGVMITWARAEGATGYDVFRSPVSDTAQAVALGSTNSTSYTDTTAENGIVYYYTVQSKNENGSSGFSALDAGHTGEVPLAAPENVTVTESSTTDGLRISWETSQFATTYYIYRSTSETDAGTLVGTTNELFFEDAEAIDGTNYFYSVEAGNGTTRSGKSAQVTVTPTPEISAPDPPQTVTASKGEFENFIVVRWSRSEGADFYRVFRGQSADPDEIAQAPAGEGITETVFQDSGAQPGRNYFYFVQAVNSAGASPFSSGDYGFTALAESADDVYENNDTMDDAYDLSGVEGRWLARSRGPAVAGNDDWYTVEMNPRESRFEVLLTFPANSGDIDMGLYDSGGNLLSESVSTTENETIAYETGKPGERFYLRVYPKNEPAGAYDLKWMSRYQGNPGNLADETIGQFPTVQYGADVFDPAGVAQNIVSKKKNNRAHRIYFTVENEGATASEMDTAASSPGRRFKSKYFLLHGGGLVNVTSLMKTGRRSAFQPLEKRLYRVDVKPKRLSKRQSARARIWISSSPGYYASATDTAGIKVIKKGKRR